jgi:hypothetical protein
MLGKVPEALRDQLGMAAIARRTYKAYRKLLDSRRRLPHRQGFCQGRRYPGDATLARSSHHWARASKSRIAAPIVSGGVERLT